MITCTEETEECSDSQLWNAFSISMLQLPSLNSKVLYFPQGHIEHFGNLDLENCPRIPAYIPCRVSAKRFMPDVETDELFQIIRLNPLLGNELDLDLDSDVGFVVENQEKPIIFCKTLSQSDVNNCGELSVSTHCAETVFPSLDYSSEPPVQTILAIDVHGKGWEFRHILSGTPKGHLLTKGWSQFMKHKKLVAGDSIMIFRATNGDVYFWIKRCKKDGSRRVEGEDVIGAMNLAVSGRAFDVFHCTGDTTPAFVVEASLVKPALQIHWCSGMRIKSASSNIRSFTGTISSVEAADPVRWPDSPWRLLQVRWDEPGVLQNVTRVNPWLVELALDTPTFHLLSLSPPPHKKLLDGKARYFVGPSNPINAPAGMQGARHGLFPPRFASLDRASPPTVPSNRLCLLTFGNSGRNLDNEKTTEEQISSSSDYNGDKIGNASDGSCSVVNLHEQSSCEGSSDM